MKAVLLDGSSAMDVLGRRVCRALTSQLKAQGWEVEHFALCESKIGNCAGDFFCWMRNPGICNINDDNRAIAESLVSSDLTVYLTPVTFGGYSSVLKRMVDHQIQNVSPFFRKIAGETHHKKRYRKNPDLLVVGWMDAPDAHSETVFHHLAWRNALNWHAKSYTSGVVLSSQSDGELEQAASKWLSELRDGRSQERPGLPATQPDGHGPINIRRALLLVGSPKTRKSTSNSLGGYLFQQLSAHSIQTETIYLHTVLRSRPKMQALLEAIDAADLVMLAFPIYVDTLPAPVIDALERIARHRHGQFQARPQLFAAVANCGYPEPYHCANALVVCETFSRQAGFAWAGSLALGAGQMINGAPLADGGGKTLLMRNALDLAAESLAQGQPITEAAEEALAKPVVPHWVYGLMAWLRWIQDARGYGALRLLKQRPYLAKTGRDPLHWLNHLPVFLFTYWQRLVQDH